MEGSRVLIQSTQSYLHWKHCQAQKGCGRRGFVRGQYCVSLLTSCRKVTAWVRPWCQIQRRRSLGNHWRVRLVGQSYPCCWWSRQKVFSFGRQVCKSSWWMYSVYEGGDNVIFIDDSIVEIMSWWKREVYVRQHGRELLWSVMVMILSCVFTQRVVLWCEAIETLICHKECYVQAACSLRV